MPVAAPAVATAAGAPAVAMAVAALVAPPTPQVPARVKRCFHAMDADGDGRVTLSELERGLGAHFVRAPRRVALSVGLRARALFDERAVGDEHFGELYVDGPAFNGLYAELLFQSFDADADDHLSHAEAHAALAFLRRGPDDDDKPPVAFACPPELYTAAGELRLPREWFRRLYSSS